MQPSIRRKLDAHAERQLSASVDLWPAIRQRVSQQPAPQVGHRGWRTLTVGAGLPLLLVVSLGLAVITTLLFSGLSPRGRGGVPAASQPTTPTVECSGTSAEELTACLLHDLPQLRQVDQLGLVQRPVATMTAHGITLTVWRAYADSNLIAVGYSVQAAPGQGVPLPRGVALVDEVGRRYSAQEGRLAEGRPCPNQLCPPSFFAGIWLIDGASLASQGDEAVFSLSIPEVVLAENLRSAATPAAMSGERLAGPWEVRFTVPILSGRVAEVQQTLISDGVALTLERVIITPAEVRFVVRGVGTRPGQMFPVPVLTRTGDGGAIMGADKDAGEGGFSRAGTDEAGITEYRLTTPPYNQPGRWSVTFRAPAHQDISSVPIGERRWTFDFTAP